MFSTRRILFIFLSIISFSLVQAQSVKLTGKVINQKNEPVSGASLVVEGTGKGTPADVEGRFVLNLEAGKKCTIIISATGYAAKSISDVEVAAGRDNTIDVILEASKKTDLEGFVVKSSRKLESTNALLSFQRNSPVMSSGLAADFIRRTPDKNTGEVLKRVSGASIRDNKFVVIRGLSDRYNQALINGAQLPSSEPDKKAFSFDVIPSQLIDNIVINKTASPDLTGEFAGGLVQITTKDIPTKNSVTVGFGLGFNTQSVFKDFISNERGKNYWLGFDDRRELPSSYPKKYGAFDALPEADRLIISSSFRDDVWVEKQSTAVPVQSYNITWANAVRGIKGGAFGSIVGVTYRNSKLLYTAKKTLFENDGATNIFDYTDNQNKYNTNLGAIANLAWTKKNHKIAFKNLYNQLFEDNYYQRNGTSDNIQNVQLRSSVLNQRSLLSSQFEGSHAFFNKFKFLWNVNYSYNHKEQPDLRVISYIKGIGTADPFSVNLRGNNTNRFFSDLTDHAFGYNASLAYDFKIGEQKQSIKIGGNSTVRLRDFKAIIFGFDEPSDPSLRVLPFDRIFSKGNFKANGFELNTNLQNPQDKYYGISALSAGFLMFDNKLSDKWRLVWGARAENFEQFLKSNKQGTDKAVVINTDKLDILPSLNLTFSPNPKSNIRLAGSKTVARPEFREIAPFAFFDFEQIASTAGLTDLKRSSIVNGDIRYEWYPKAGELISAGVFYKDFTDPIELRLNSASGGTRRQYEFQNALNATLYGTEIEFRKSLSFISKSKEWLEKLFFTGNASIIFSEVKIGGLDQAGNPRPALERPLQGQSPYLLNAGFQYDSKSGTGISFFYNRIGERLSLVGNADFGDIYERPRDLVDFQLSQKILKRKGEVRLTVSDILNQSVATYENKNSRKAFDTNIDKTFSSYKPGTTFTVAFTYDFDLKGK